MNINLQDVNIQTRSLAERIINARAWEQEQLSVPELCAKEKRFLTRHGFSYSYNVGTLEWEIQLENEKYNG